MSHRSYNRDIRENAMATSIPEKQIKTNIMFVLFWYWDDTLSYIDIPEIVL